VITGIMSGASLSGKQEDNRLKQVFLSRLVPSKINFKINSKTLLVYDTRITHLTHFILSNQSGVRGDGD
jgi:ABC-type uncharacterized transport system involved in gliding motility auxiliary subunit